MNNKIGPRGKKGGIPNGLYPSSSLFVLTNIFSLPDWYSKPIFDSWTLPLRFFLQLVPLVKKRRRAIDKGGGKWGLAKKAGGEKRMVVVPIFGGGERRMVALTRNVLNRHLGIGLRKKRVRAILYMCTTYLQNLICFKRYLKRPY